MRIGLITFFIFQLFFGCNSNIDSIVYNTPDGFQLSKIDSLEIINKDAREINSVLKILYLKSLKQIDSLKKIIAFKDSNTIIMLQSIEYGLEYISDEGLQNLIEIKNK